MWWQSVTMLYKICTSFYYQTNVCLHCHVFHFPVPHEKSMLWSPNTDKGFSERPFDFYGGVGGAGLEDFFFLNFSTEFC